MADQTVGEERTATAVLEDHLRVSKEGSVEEDLARNYAPDLVVLTRRGIFRGHDGLHHLADLLRRELPNCTYEYETKLVEGNVAFLEWTARADGARVDDGAETFVIRKSRIVAQTIHYTVRRVPASRE